MAAGESAAEGQSQASVDAEGVRAALERIDASEDFAASDRARRFLRFVVEETLAGRADRIKAFSVAVEVFGRDESFDPQNDPVVRIEAGRLRRALERYYLLSGKDDPVVIDIPKGGYVPTFSERATAEIPAGTAPAGEPAPDSVAPEPAEGPSLPATAPPPRFRPFHGALILVALLVVAAGAWLALVVRPFDTTAAPLPPGGPRILVLPFTELGSDELTALYADALTDEIVTALGHFKEITVLGAQTSRSLPSNPDYRTLHDDLGVEYVIEGSARADADVMRVAVRVTSSVTGAVLWSRSYENPINPKDLFLLPAKTAGEIAAAVAQPYGIVFQAETAREAAAPPDNLDAYLCTLNYYAYRADITPENYADVRRCLEQTVKRFPEYATAWALIAHIYLDEIRTGFASGDSPPVERALAAARTAVRLDPDNIRALQALASSLYFHHDLDEAFAVGDRALALNPNDSELLGQLGHLEGLSGRFDEGRALLERALAGNPAQSDYYRGVLAMVAYMQEDYATARREIEQTGLIKLPIFHGVAAIVYAQNGLMDRAREELDQFQRMAPDFVPSLWAELDARNIPADIQLRIGEDLARLGAVIPPRPQVTVPTVAGAG